MQRVNLKAGDVVKAGETVLTRIEPTLSPLLDARARSQAQARVDAATATRSRANEDIEMSRTGLKYAQAKLGPHQEQHRQGDRQRHRPRYV
jgi:HlyD family secretion protein